MLESDNFIPLIAQTLSMSWGMVPASSTGSSPRLIVTSKLRPRFSSTLPLIASTCGVTVSSAFQELVAATRTVSAGL